MIDAQLQGRVALVTGANHGIGAAIAIALARQGARVFITYLRLPPRTDPTLPPAYNANVSHNAGNLLAGIRRSGGLAEAWEADLRETGTVRKLFDRAEAAFGPVEVLVNNADASTPDSFLGNGIAATGLATSPVTAESKEEHFAVNSRAAALLIAEFARRHLEREATWGRIIGITSAGRDGFPGEASYGASKAALESYTFTAGDELARHGVTSNIVEPAGTDTGWINAELAEWIEQRSPFGRVGQPEDVAELVVFLASHQARFLTGQRLRLQ